MFGEQQTACCMRQPPPIFTLATALIVLAIPIIGVALIRHGGRPAFIVKLLLMTVVLCLVPSLLAFLGKLWGKFLEAVVQAVAATIIVTVFSLWLIGRSSLGKWIAVLFVLLVVILVGQYLGTLIQDKIVHRLSEAKDFGFSRSEISRLKETAKPQVIFYASLPLGAIIATAYGLMVGMENKEILVFFVPSILAIASIQSSFGIE